MTLDFAKTEAQRRSSVLNTTHYVVSFPQGHYAWGIDYMVMTRVPDGYTAVATYPHKLTLLERVELAKTQITADIAAGKIDAPNVSSFSDLHNFVDANEYGFADAFDMGAVCDTYQADDCKLMNEMQDTLDAWIKSSKFVQNERVLMARIVSELASHGISANMEETGGNIVCVAILVQAGVYMFGTANDTWGASFFPGLDSDTRSEYLELNIPTTSTDIKTIAASMWDAVKPHVTR